MLPRKNKTVELLSERHFCLEINCKPTCDCQACAFVHVIACACVRKHVGANEAHKIDRSGGGGGDVKSD